VKSNLKQLKILVDMDGVLADTHLELISRCNAEHEAQMEKKHLTHWDLTKVQKPGMQLSKYFKIPGFFASLPVYEGAREGVSALASIKCLELFVASASSSVGYAEKHEWLKQHFPEIPETNIVFAVRKDLLAGDVLIDDGAHNINLTICPNAIVFDQPWNQEEIKPRTGLFRAYSWPDVVSIIYRLLKERRTA